MPDTEGETGGPVARRRWACGRWAAVGGAQARLTSSWQAAPPLPCEQVLDFGELLTGGRPHGSSLPSIRGRAGLSGRPPDYGSQSTGGALAKRALPRDAAQQSYSYSYSYSYSKISVRVRVRLGAAPRVRPFDIAQARLSVADLRNAGAFRYGRGPNRCRQKKGAPFRERL
jgi:hypothetical protein